MISVQTNEKFASVPLGFAQDYAASVAGILTMHSVHVVVNLISLPAIHLYCNKTLAAVDKASMQSWRKLRNY
jgi:hypothetical protein